MFYSNFLYLLLPILRHKKSQGTYYITCINKNKLDIVRSNIILLTIELFFYLDGHDETTSFNERRWFGLNHFSNSIFRKRI